MSPETKAKRLAHSREYGKTYRQTEAFKVSTAKSQSKPETRQRKLAYNKIYYKTAEGRATIKADYARNRYKYILQGIRRHAKIKNYAPPTISIADVKILFETQLCCAICGIIPTDRLRLDHCHKTGKVRGLLCNRCNMALGFFNDEPEIMRKSLTYLERNLL